MKLDKRVKENALIGHYFNSNELKKYIGQECYFVDALEDFSDLTGVIKTELKTVEPDRDNCYLAGVKINGIPAVLCYGFCLHAEFVEEKNDL